MATLGASKYTMLDIAKGMDPNGSVARVIELLSQMNEILSDMPFIEGNLPTGHQTTVRTSLPTPTPRRLNRGTVPTKSTKAQIVDTCAMLEDFSEVDVKVAQLSKNIPEFRLGEARAHIEGMAQGFANQVIYGNSATTPEHMNGLAVRHNSLSGNNARCIVNAGGSGSDNTSIYLVVWHPDAVTGIYPQGSQAGLVHEDLGIETVNNAGGVTGALMRAYRDRFAWDFGLAVKDWRQVGRICNIDVSALVAMSGDAELTDKMTILTHRIQSLSMGTPVWYGNRTVKTYLDLQAQRKVKNGGGVTYENFDGKPVLMVRGIPFRTVDAILDTEAAVA